MKMTQMFTKQQSERDEFSIYIPTLSIQYAGRTIARVYGIHLDYHQQEWYYQFHKTPYLFDPDDHHIGTFHTKQGPFHLFFQSLKKYLS